MARIYAKHGFKASSINADFYRFLESLDDQAVVLLEFVSQGSNSRQVDCAILSSGGVDLLEIKDKRGRIEGHAAQPWTVIDAQKISSIPCPNRYTSTVLKPPPSTHHLHRRWPTFTP